MAKSATVRNAAAATVSVIVLAAAFIGGTGSSATAVQGQVAIAGATNTETSSTGFADDSYSTTCNGFSNVGVVGCGQLGGQFYSDILGVYGAGTTGVWGVGGTTGVQGSGPTGILGEATGGANSLGVKGQASNSGGSGVYGNNGGVGYGVTGVANNGTGVFGASSTGTGVLGQGGENGVYAQGGTFGVFATGEDYGIYASGPAHGVFGQATGPGGAGVDAASSGNNFALRVTGKAQFSRSGRAVVAGGQSSIVVPGVAVGGKSLVLATAQKNVGGVYVQAAVPDTTAKTVTIYLNTTVGANYPVAWMVVERP